MSSQISTQPDISSKSSSSELSPHIIQFRFCYNQNYTMNHLTLNISYEEIKKVMLEWDGYKGGVLDDPFSQVVMTLTWDNNRLVISSEKEWNESISKIIDSKIINVTYMLFPIKKISYREDEELKKILNKYKSILKVENLDAPIKEFEFK